MDASFLMREQAKFHIINALVLDKQIKHLPAMTSTIVLWRYYDDKPLPLFP